MGEFEGFGQADDAGHVVGAGDEAVFLMAAEGDRLEFDICLLEEEAGAFGAVGFAGVEGEELEAEFLNVEVFGIGALASVAVEGDVMFVGDFCERRDVLESADFVLAVDDRDEEGFGCDGLFEGFGGDESLLVWLEGGDFEAFFFQLFGSFVDGRMFDGRDDEVVFGGGFVFATVAEKGKVVGESTAGSKYDF